MRSIISVAIILGLCIFIVPQAHAIIFLPAAILIPIAKIVALIIGGFSFPALGIGALWSKLFHTSLKRTLLIIIFILLCLSLLLVIFFKMHNPDRPLF
ncbi:MAG TPA: hypothetical protein VLF89_00895 [Candidatus Saccharimonadales bacterium]|nr:hypothetical protein [Candidatus Saccharimonadales bacterium]